MGPGDAEPLLLAAGEAQGVLLQAVLHLVPDGGAPEGALHDVVQLGLAPDAVGPGTVGNIVVDAHGEGVGLLEDHADLPPQGADIHTGGEDVLALVVHLAGDLHAGDQVIHPVQGLEEGGLAAAGGPDQGRDALLRHGEGDVVEGVMLPVPEVQGFCFQDVAHRLLLFRKYRPTAAAARLMSRVRPSRMAAMAKASSKRPSSLA